MTIGESLGHGYTGQVYRADLTGRSLPGLVLKLATTREQLCRLRHEYTIYSHLSAASVAGIPSVFGFFQDGDRNVGAMVLSDAGVPLAMRRQPGEAKITLSSQEK